MGFFFFTTIAFTVQVFEFVVTVETIIYVIIGATVRGESTPLDLRIQQLPAKPEFMPTNRCTTYVSTLSLFLCDCQCSLSSSIFSHGYSNLIKATEPVSSAKCSGADV